MNLTGLNILKPRKFFKSFIIHYLFCTFAIETVILLSPDWAGILKVIIMKYFLILIGVLLISFSNINAQVNTKKGPAYKNAKSSEKYSSNHHFYTIESWARLKGPDAKNKNSHSPYSLSISGVANDHIMNLPYRMVLFHNFHGINATGFKGPKYKNFKYSKKIYTPLRSLKNNMHVND